MDFLFRTLAVLSAYLLGAIPFGFLVAKAQGIDIRNVGSGNIGATNVFRAVGKRWGILTLILDAAKGFVAVFWFPFLLAGTSAPDTLRLLCALGAVIGHNWPVYLKFHGGKGVAVSVGVLLGLAWPVGLIGIGSWILVFTLSRIVSLSSIIAAATIGASVWFPWPSDPAGFFLPVSLSILAITTILRHHANIRRLFAGSEPRITIRGRPPESLQSKSSPHVQNTFHSR